jgi:hypothetical protein
MFGWQCAWLVTGSLWSSDLHWGAFQLRLIGLTNPLIAAYLLSIVTRRGTRYRSSLAASILATIGVTWILLGNGGFDLRVGHAMWVSGMLLILTPQLAMWRFTVQQQTAGETAAEPTTGTPVLCVVSGPHGGQTVSITAAEFWIGSQSNNHLCLGGDSRVSGNHACIKKQPDGFHLYDHASRNGTWVNGESIGSRIVLLRIGDGLKVGSSEIRLQASNAVGKAS